MQIWFSFFFFGSVFPLYILARASKRQLQYVLLVCKCFNAAHFGLCSHTHLNPLNSQHTVCMWCVVLSDPHQPSSQCLQKRPSAQQQIPAVCVQDTGTVEMNPAKALQHLTAFIYTAFSFNSSLFLSCFSGEPSQKQHGRSGCNTRMVVFSDKRSNVTGKDTLQQVNKASSPGYYIQLISQFLHPW